MSDAIVRSTRFGPLPASSVVPNEAESTPGLEVSAVHAAHVDFVWATLQRFGVRDADLEDMVQEVFVVVHRKLSTFDGRSRVTTWLFGICMRVATGYRRRAYVRREQSVPSLPDETRDERQNPEELADTRQQRALISAILDTLSLEKRAVFVMFEIDGLSCGEIASVVGIPVGTVYSRLHAARGAFEQALTRWRARAMNPNVAAREPGGSTR